MNNLPAMTEERRQELIELCEEVLACHVQYGGDSNEEDIYKIALAALTAEPNAWIVHAHGGDQLTDDGDYVANAEGMHNVRASPLFTAPPAPVLRLPDEADTSHLPFAAMAWNACLAEVKRLNTQPSPPETSNEQ